MVLSPTLKNVLLIGKSTSLLMTIHSANLLTPEEFASLIEVALTTPAPKISNPHLTKLVGLGYIVQTAKGLVVTGDGLMRITESE